MPLNRLEGLRTALAIALAMLAAGVASPQEHASPIDIARGADGTLYVAGHTAGRIMVARPGEAGTVVQPTRIDVGGPPAAVAVSPDGATLYAVVSEPAGSLCVIDAKSGKVTKRIPVGHSPADVALNPDGTLAYVCNQFTDDVSVVDLKTGTEKARVAVVREPIAVAVAPDGTALVANQLPAQAANSGYAAAVVSVIDGATLAKAVDLVLPNGSNGLKGVAVSPDGQRAYVTHILARYQLPTTQLERGWMNTNALSVIDVPGRRLLATVLLDDVDLGAANPWGVEVSADGSLLCVAHAGTHEISVIDRKALEERLDRAAKGEQVTSVTKSLEDVCNDLSFLVGIRRRVALAGNGPRGIALVDGRAYAAEYFSDSLGVVDLDPESRTRPVSVPLGPEVEMTIVRRGEMYFHDADLCFQKWQSCSSCHPGGARSDALNWDLLNDGMGNPKNSKNLLLAHQTPPAMISGVRPRAEVAVRAGIRYIQFAERPEADAEALDEYLKSLRPVPSPRLVKGKLSASAERGKRAFVKASCQTCHPAPLYTDMELHQVRTGTGLDEGREWDTPTLIEVWRTAPYLHDGRAATMREVLTTHNPGDAHGVTSGLTEQEIEDLAEFVLSL